MDALRFIGYSTFREFAESINFKLPAPGKDLSNLYVTIYQNYTPRTHSCVKIEADGRSLTHKMHYYKDEDLEAFFKLQNLN